MKLWIRSQDKEILGTFKDIAIRESSLVETINGNQLMYEIVGYFDKETQYETLGKYIGKLRALEVLDEIQKNLDTNREAQYVTTNTGGICSKGCVIYQMPQE